MLFNILFYAFILFFILFLYKVYLAIFTKGSSVILKKPIISILATILTLAFIPYYILYHYFVVEVSVVNNSFFDLKNITVMMSGQSETVDRLARDSRIKTKFRDLGDSDVAVRAELDGRIFECRGDYVTSNSRATYRLIVSSVESITFANITDDRYWELPCATVEQ